MTMTNTRRKRMRHEWLAALTVLMFTTTAGPASADYPERPISLILPTPPGGAADLNARHAGLRAGPTDAGGDDLGRPADADRAQRRPLTHDQRTGGRRPQAAGQAQLRLLGQLRRGAFSDGKAGQGGRHQHAARALWWSGAAGPVGRADRRDCRRAVGGQGGGGRRPTAGCACWRTGAASASACFPRRRP